MSDLLKLIAALEGSSFLVDCDLDSDAPYTAVNLDEAIALIREAFEGKVLADTGVLALVIKDHTFLSEGICVCSYCGQDDYYPRKITHKDTCPVVSIKAMLAAQGVDDNG